MTKSGEAVIDPDALEKLFPSWQDLFRQQGLEIPKPIAFKQPTQPPTHPARPPRKQPQGETPTPTLAAAMDVLAREIQCDDGVANAAIAEAAERLRTLERELAEANAKLHALRLVCGTTDANKFETVVDRLRAQLATAETFARAAVLALMRAQRAASRGAEEAGKP